MTKLRIHHETLYTYTNRVRFGLHRLITRPREGHDLRVESMELSVSPPAQVTWIRDVFGNSIALLRFKKAAQELRIVSDVEVSRSSPYSHRRYDRASSPFPPVYEPLETAVVSAYQQLSYPADSVLVAKWVRDQSPKPPKDVESLVRRLNEGVHRQIRYVRRDERGVQTPAETIEKGAGSCRDLATLLLDAVRSRGIAARFASGYMECSAAEAGHASTHAWIEIYLPGHGWRGYDPTAGGKTSERHVATGLSNHPRGVMPVVGSYYGRAAEFKAMTVVVKLTRG